MQRTIWSAHYSCEGTIRLMKGDALFAHILFRRWEGREGWQYVRHGYTSVRTRKLRDTAIEAMMSAPRLPRADRQAAANAIARIAAGADVFDRIVHMSDAEQAILAEIKRQLSPQAQHGALARHLPDADYPHVLLVKGRLDVSQLVSAIEQDLQAN